MVVIGWILWGLGLIFALVILITIILERIWKINYPQDLRRKKLILELLILSSVVISLFITLMYNISRIHLVWLLPVSFGVPLIFGGPTILLIEQIFLRMKKIILWILILSGSLVISLVSFVLVDILGTAILGNLSFIGNHASLFITYFMAVYIGAFFAPQENKNISIVLAAMWLLLRAVQTILVFAGSMFTEDTPALFATGTLFALFGAMLGIYMATKKENKLLFKMRGSKLKVGSKKTTMDGPEDFQNALINIREGINLYLRNECGFNESSINDTFKNLISQIKIPKRSHSESQEIIKAIKNNPEALDIFLLGIRVKTKLMSEIGGLKTASKGLALWLHLESLGMDVGRHAALHDMPTPDEFVSLTSKFYNKCKEQYS